MPIHVLSLKSEQNKDSHKKISDSRMVYYPTNATKCRIHPRDGTLEGPDFIVIYEHNWCPEQFRIRMILHTTLFKSRLQRAACDPVKERWTIETTCELLASSSRRSKNMIRITKVKTTHGIFIQNPLYDFASHPVLERWPVNTTCALSLRPGLRSNLGFA